MVRGFVRRGLQLALCVALVAALPLTGCVLPQLAPAPPAASFLLIREHLAWLGPLDELVARAQPALEHQGAVLQSQGPERARYRLDVGGQDAKLVLQRDASGVSLKITARGPYVGLLALRVAACKKALRAASVAPEPAAAAAAASPPPSEPVPETGPTPVPSSAPPRAVSPPPPKQGKP